MKCIFCEQETNGLEPIEHILPESMGNTKHVLRRGLVCGKCNNYFASKIEKPFLENASVTATRFHQAIPNKKGRVPKMTGILRPYNIPVELTRSADGNTEVRVPSEEFQKILEGDNVSLLLLGSNLMVISSVVSRFVAKVAVEALAQRIEENDDFLEEFFKTEELKAIRKHARYGTMNEWPVSIRRIYDENSRWQVRGWKANPAMGEDEACQIVHEFDFLFTSQNELYFVLAIFGQEFTVNLGGPELEGWYAWLEQHNNVSPLNYGKNAEGEIQLEDGNDIRPHFTPDAFEFVREDGN